jgi:HlyD family secretion protein
MEKNKIDEIRSSEVQEILSFIPHWIVRWGITVFFFTLCVILLASWFIRYPDMVNSRIVITSEDPPASIIARTSGNLYKFVKEGDMVKKGQYLGMIENAADEKDIEKLRATLDSFKTVLAKPELLVQPFPFDEELSLGELQGEYLSFVKAYNNYRFAGKLDFHQKQVSSLRSQVTYYEKLNTELETQRKLMERDLELAMKKYKADQQLFSEKAIPQAEMDKSESEYLNNQRNYENAKSSIISNSIQVAELEKRIMDLTLQGMDSDNNTFTSLQDAFRRLQGQFAVWEQQYMLKSPTAGVVTFFKFWSNNRFVNMGEEVMTIVPGSQQVFGLLQVPVYGSGKVKEGQRIKIRVDNYPSEEYGMVEATVESISPVPRNGMYSIRAKLDNGLRTTYNKHLEFKTEMQGSADIVTDNLRLIERIFNQFRSIFNRSLET